VLRPWGETTRPPNSHMRKARVDLGEPGVVIKVRHPEPKRRDLGYLSEADVLLDDDGRTVVATLDPGSSVMTVRPGDGVRVRDGRVLFALWRRRA
jgi:hypothetical protein